MTAGTGGVERWLRRERTQVGLLAVAVALPVLVAGIRMASGWVPAIDDATIATRAYDVLSSHPPLVGQYSLAGEVAQASAHSPGPLLYWLLALPARVGPAWSLPLVVATVNATLLASVVVLAHRRAGLGFAWATAAGLLMLVRAYGPVTLAEIWNPWAALVPFTALVFVCWSVAEGDRWLLPVGIVLASLAMQAHLTYVVPSVGMLVVALVGGWLVPPPGRPRRWAPTVVAAAVGLVCWSAPFYEQATRDPGNLTLVARAGQAEGRRGGLDAVRGSLWRTLGLPPRWARSEANPAAEILEGLLAPGPAATIGTVLALAVLVAVAATAVRRRDRTMVVASTLVAVLLAGLVFVTANLPLARAMVAGYSFRWFAAASLFSWLIAGLGLHRFVVAPAFARRRAGRPVDRSEAGTEAGTAAAGVGTGAAEAGTGPVDGIALDGGTGSPGTRSGRRPPAAVVAVGVVALAALGLAVPSPDSAAWAYRPARDLGDLVEAATEPGGTYLLSRSGPFDVAFTPAMVWRLRTTGRHPVLAPPADEAFGDAYRAQGVRCDGIFVLEPPSSPLTEGAEVLGVVPVPDGPGVPAEMRVELAPDTSSDGLC